MQHDIVPSPYDEYEMIGIGSFLMTFRFLFIFHSPIYSGGQKSPQVSPESNWNQRSARARQVVQNMLVSKHLCKCTKELNNSPKKMKWRIFETLSSGYAHPLFFVKGTALNIMASNLLWAHKKTTEDQQWLGHSTDRSISHLLERWPGNVFTMANCNLRPWISKSTFMTSCFSLSLLRTSKSGSFWWDHPTPRFSRLDKKYTLQWLNTCHEPCGTCSFSQQQPVCRRNMLSHNSLRP